jgi:polar amino acid transport system substrate-binding protein
MQCAGTESEKVCCISRTLRLSAIGESIERRIIMGNIAMSILVLFAVSTSGIADAGTKDLIPVVVDANYPPYSFGTAEHADGLYTRLIEEIFSRCGMKAEVRALHWKDALQEGEEGRAAVGGIYKTKARMKIYDYSKPFFEERLAVYVQKGKAFPFARLSDLQGLAIGLNRAWSYGDEFDAARKEYHYTVEEVDSNLQNFNKLVAGRIDCLVADQLAASRIIRRENWGDRVERLDRPVAVNPAHLAFAKRLDKRQVLEEFDQALAAMKKDGTYEKLVQAFMSDVPDPKMKKE